jgi:hypothetical protein
VREPHTGLRNSRAQETFGKRGEDVDACRRPAGRLAADSDLGRVALEGRNVLLNPAQCSLLVENAVVAPYLLEYCYLVCVGVSLVCKSWLRIPGMYLMVPSYRSSVPWSWAIQLSQLLLAG